MSQRNQTHSTIQEINPDLYPGMYTAVILLIVMSVSTATIDRNAASQELSALYNDNGAHVGTDLDARPQGHRVGCSFIRSLIRKSRRIALLLFSP